MTFYSSSQWARFRFTVSNPCGSISNDYYFRSINCGGGGGGGGGCLRLNVSPNPTTSNTIRVTPNSRPCGSVVAAGGKSANGQLLSFVDGQVIREFSFDLTSEGFEIDASGLKKGTYILRFRLGDDIETHRVELK
jgi:hypothetical protein